MHFFTGLRPKLETIRSLLLNRERSISFDESVVHVIKEESRLQSMQAPTRHESQILLTKSATATSLPNIPTNVHGQPNNAGAVQMPPTKPSYNQAPATKRGYQKKKGDAMDNLWRDFCQRYRHKRETCWKLHGRPAISKSHIVTHGGSWQHYQNPSSTSTVNLQHHPNIQLHCHPQPSVEKKRDGSIKSKTEASRRSTFKFLIYC